MDVTVADGPGFLFEFYNNPPFRYAISKGIAKTFPGLELPDSSDGDFSNLELELVENTTARPAPVATASFRMRGLTLDGLTKSGLLAPTKAAIRKSMARAAGVADSSVNVLLVDAEGRRLATGTSTGVDVRVSIILEALRAATADATVPDSVLAGIRDAMANTSAEMLADIEAIPGMSSLEIGSLTVSDMVANVVTPVVLTLRYVMKIPKTVADAANITANYFLAAGPLLTANIGESLIAVAVKSSTGEEFLIFQVATSLPTVEVVPSATTTTITTTGTWKQVDLFEVSLTMGVTNAEDFAAEATGSWKSSLESALVASVEGLAGGSVSLETVTRLTRLRRLATPPCLSCGRRLGAGSFSLIFGVQAEGLSAAGIASAVGSNFAAAAAAAVPGAGITGISDVLVNSRGTVFVSGSTTTTGTTTTSYTGTTSTATTSTATTATATSSTATTSSTSTWTATTSSSSVTSTTTTSSTTSVSTTTTSTTIPEQLSEIPEPDAAKALNIIIFVLGMLCLCCCMARICRVMSRRPDWGLARINIRGKAEDKQYVISHQAHGTAGGKTKVTWKLTWRDIRDLNLSPAESEASEVNIVMDMQERGLHGGRGVGLNIEVPTDVLVSDGVLFSLDGDASPPARAAGIDGEGREGSACTVLDTDIDDIWDWTGDLGEADEVSQAVPGGHRTVASSTVAQRTLETKQTQWQQPHSSAVAVLSEQVVAPHKSIGLFIVGDTVEYWSGTHARWTKAWIVSCNHHDQKDRPLLVLSISAGQRTQRRQIRSDVTADRVRALLQPAEKVEVYRGQTNGWHPATLCAKQSQLASIRGYIVTATWLAELKKGLFETTHPDEPKRAAIPARLVRRRYDDGDQVEVYRGPPEGWVLAEVVPARIDTSMDDCNWAMEKVPPPLSAYSPGHMPSQASASRFGEDTGVSSDLGAAISGPLWSGMSNMSFDIPVTSPLSSGSGKSMNSPGGFGTQVSGALMSGASLGSSHTLVSTESAAKLPPQPWGGVRIRRLDTGSGTGGGVELWPAYLVRPVVIPVV